MAMPLRIARQRYVTVTFTTKMLPLSNNFNGWIAGIRGAEDSNGYAEKPYAEGVEKRGELHLAGNEYVDHVVAITTASYSRDLHYTNITFLIDHFYLDDPEIEEV